MKGDAKIGTLGKSFKNCMVSTCFGKNTQFYYISDESGFNFLQNRPPTGNSHLNAMLLFLYQK